MNVDYKARKAYYQDYYRRNRDRINKRCADYIKNHPEERKEYRRLWYIHHREEHLARVKARQKKYYLNNYSYLAEQHGVRWENYRKRLSECKTQWERNELRKKYEAAKKSAINCKKNVAVKRLERDKIRRKARREAKVQENIKKFLPPKNTAHETKANSTESTD